MAPRRANRGPQNSSSTIRLSSVCLVLLSVLLLGSSLFFFKTASLQPQSAHANHPKAEFLSNFLKRERESLDSILRSAVDYTSLHGDDHPPTPDQSHSSFHQQTPVVEGKKEKDAPRGDYHDPPVSTNEGQERRSKRDIECDSMEYWANPSARQIGSPGHASATVRNDRDRRVSDNRWVSPWKDPQQEKFITFEPDHGGWNNIRMAVETVATIARMTGRTLVLPPSQPMYLLSKDNKKHKNHHFGDFFPLAENSRSSDPATKFPVRMLSTAEFLQIERDSDRLPEKLHGLIDQDKLDTNNEARKTVFAYLRDESVAINPIWKPMEQSLIFPTSPKTSLDTDMSDPDVAKRVKAFALQRKVLYDYNHNLSSSRIIHIASDHKTHRRLLTHFYLFLHFVDPAMHRLSMRFVRDHFHYHRPLFCAAQKAIKALKAEGHGSYSSFHIRRGDFQYKQVKLGAGEIFNNTIDVLREGEVVYIATDEQSTEFFQPFNQRYTVRTLKDILHLVDVEGLGDPNYIGMLEQIVASHGRNFIGTWYSTFTGYINRLRGYYGFPKTTSYYFWGPKKFQMHEPDFPQGKLTSSYAREWPVAWVGIDEVSP